jgi:hypothetical protein
MDIDITTFKKWLFVFWIKFQTNKIWPEGNNILDLFYQFL